MGSNLANGHYHLLFNLSQNVCSLANETKASVLASIVRPLWEAHTNAPFRCPIQPVSIKSFHNFMDSRKVLSAAALSLLFVFIYL